MSTLARAEVWRLLGEPTDQIGSVNDPRTREEQSHRWNEKWIYRDDEGRAFRAVLWHRYDLVGVFAVAPDGRLEPEPLLHAS